MELLLHHYGALRYVSPAGAFLLEERVHLNLTYLVRVRARAHVQHVRSGFLNSNRASRREVSTYHRGIWDAMDQVPGLCLD